MNKELTPLEAFNYIKNGFPMKTSDLESAFEIIETALKNYQKLSKQRYVIFTRTHQQKEKFINDICKSYKEIKVSSLEDDNKLKALEIIIEKDVNIHYLKICFERANGLELYNSGAVWFKLTQEEYELLKEVLP